MPLPTGSEQQILDTRPSVNAEGRPIVQRVKAISCFCGQKVTIRHVMRSTRGDPVNFSDLSSPSLKVRVREALTHDVPQEYPGNVLDASTGLVSLDLPPEQTQAPGVSRLDFGVFRSGQQEPVFINTVYLIVNKSLWADPQTSPIGPPTLDEIRLFLRDSGPEDNLWRDNEEFDNAEIADAIIRPVQHWNNSQPPIDLNYTTATYPFRDPWMQGIAGLLFLSAARHYRRVHLPYQAGGVTLNDNNRAQEYETIGKELWLRYSDWVRLKKIQLNCDSVWRTLPSCYWPYPY